MRIPIVVKPGSTVFSWFGTMTIMILPAAFLLLSAAGNVQSPGVLVPAGPTQVARFSHTATLLKTGEVLLAGGMERNGVWLNSAELFEPGKRSFRTTDPMRWRRAGAVAVLLQDGTVLIAGGTDGSGKSLATTEIYAPATHSFTTGRSMLTGRNHAVAIPLNNGKILIAGGSQDGDNGALATAELYDPQTGRFSATGSMHSPRSYFNAVALKDGRVLVTGGLGPGDVSNGTIEFSAELYDPATGHFGPTGSMSVSRYKHGNALLVNGDVLVVGGQNRDADGSRLSSTEVYDVAAGRFIAGPALNLRRFKLPLGVVALMDGRILVAGGALHPEIYESRSNFFTTSDGAAIDGFLFSSATMLSDGRVLLAGGYGDHPTAGAVRQAWLWTSTSF